MVRVEEEFRLSLMRGGCCHPPLHPAFKVQNRPAGPAQSPTTCSLGEASASLYILPAFPVLTAGRCLRLVLELAPHCVFRADMPVEIAARIIAIFTWLQCRRRRLHVLFFLCSRKRKKPQREIKNYWFFSAGPQQLMMINDGDVSPMPSEDHSNFCKLH